MTANVINYLNERETERSNVAREVETNRHNRQVEYETGRHNRAMERLEEARISASRQQAQLQHSASKYASDLNLKGTTLSVGAQTQRNTYDYLLGRANVSATRERTAVQDRYNRGQLAIASLARAEERRHNKETESISYLREANTMQRFAEQLLLDKTKHQHQEWKDFQDIRVREYEQNTKRADMIWRNTNQTARLAKDWLATSPKKQSTLEQFFEGMRD